MKYLLKYTDQNEAGEEVIFWMEVYMSKAGRREEIRWPHNKGHATALTKEEIVRWQSRYSWLDPAKYGHIELEEDLNSKIDESDVGLYPPKRRICIT